MYFNIMEMDFIALESCILNFETMNDIYDNSCDEAPIAYATESTGYVFGTDLFVNSIATESIASPAMEGVGSKIWGAIKSVFNAIANFFKNLFTKSNKVKSNVQSKSSSSASAGQTSPQKTESKDEHKARRIEEEKKEEEEDLAQKEKRRQEREKEDERDRLERASKNFQDYRSLYLKAKAELTDLTNTYFKMLITALNIAGDSSFVIIMKRITQTFASIRQSGEFNSKKMTNGPFDQNSPGRLYLNYNTTKRDDSADYKDNARDDLSNLGKVNEKLKEAYERVERLKITLEEKQKSWSERLRNHPYRECGNWERKQVEQDANDIKQIRLTDSQGSNRPQILKTLEQISKTSKSNWDFCEDIIKFCEKHETDLDDDGRLMFALTKKYMEASKYYNKLTNPALRLFNSYTSEKKAEEKKREDIKKSKWNDEAYWYTH